MFEVFDQCRARLLGLATALRERMNDIVPFARAVAVPAAMVELNKANPAFDQPPREQAIIGERRLARLRSIHFVNMLGFLGDVHQFRRTRLHPVGHFKGVDARGDLRIADVGKAVLIQISKRVERGAADRPGSCRRDWKGTEPGRLASER